MLSVIQTIAMNVATLSNKDLDALAKELVRVFPERADRLEQLISMHTQELINELEAELGVDFEA